MAYIETRDGTPIYYKDWGRGPAVVFSHGWPLNADSWDEQLVSVAGAGFRGIAYDRRGFGRSGQPASGYHMDGFADDLADLIDELQLRDIVLVGHSMGGGEVARYLGRHGSARVAKVALVSAVPPSLVRTANNPAGLPPEVVAGLRAGLAADRSQFFRDLGGMVFGADRAGVAISQGVRDAFWMWAMQAGLMPALACLDILAESDFTSDLAKINVPTLLVHGDDDQIVPMASSSLLSARLIAGAILKVYEGAPHGIPVTHRHRLDQDLLAFIGGRPLSESRPTGSLTHPTGSRVAS